MGGLGDPGAFSAAGAEGPVSAELIRRIDDLEQREPMEALLFDSGDESRFDTTFTDDRERDVWELRVPLYVS